MDLDHTQIIIASIAAAPVILGAWWTFKVNIEKIRLEKENKAMQREMNVQRTALSGFGGLMLKFSVVEEEARRLCAQTSISRILILCAWNGDFSPKWTTAVWQHVEKTTPVSYIHVGLDDDYVERLRQIEKNNSILFNTDDAPESLIKQIYESEDVSESLWVFLSAAETTDKKGRLITYMSFSSQGGIIDRVTRVKCELLANRIAPLTGIDLGDTND